MNTYIKLLFSLSILFPPTIIHGFCKGNDALLITHGPYLQNVTEQGVTIVFTTSKLVVPGVMLSSDGENFELIQNSRDGLINVGDNIHKVRIDHLESGTNYHERLFPRF